MLAYIVDANAGRSSSAVATNSVFRGVFAFISTETAVPMQVSMTYFSIIYYLICTSGPFGGW
jgi:hypothetical protein